MTQSAEKVIDHELLFRQPEYTAMFENKQKNFEYKHAEEKIIEIREWTKTKEYQDKNFARTALTIIRPKPVNRWAQCLPPSVFTRPCPLCMDRKVASLTTVRISHATSRNRPPASLPQ